MASVKVTLIYNGVKREILRWTLKNSEYFLDNYEKGKDLFWEGPYSQECFSDFLQLLENSRYSEDKRNPNIIQLLEDWGCSDIIKNVISQVKSEFDHTIIHNGHQYQVNLRTFSTLSHYFCSQVKSSPGTVVSVSDEYSEETFSLFLDCLHGIKSLPQDGKLVEVYILSQNWKCNSLLGLINSKSTSFILSALSKGDLIDQKMVEENATQQILTLIQDPRFYQLPLSALSRIISKSCINEEINSLFLFIKNLFEAYGIEAFFLIFSLDFHSCTEETVLKILEIMSKHSHSSLFLLLKNKLLLQVEREKAMRKTIIDFLEIWKTTQPPDFDNNIINAAQNGKLSSVVYLLSHGTCVNSKNSSNCTPLHYAAQKGHLSVVEYLVNQKADINARNIFKETPLHYAAVNGHLSVVEFLVNQKADINAKNDDSQTPLHLAAINGHLSVGEYLVTQKADINAKNIFDSTPLHSAAKNGHLSIIEYLVNQKADVNAQDKDGWTPLHYAAEKGHLSIVENLVNHKAEIMQKKDMKTRLGVENFPPPPTSLTPPFPIHPTHR